MPVYLGSGGVEYAIAALAARQHGVMTRAQLVQAGLTRGAIEHRLATARLHRLHQGVYAVGYPAKGREARWIAAVLACGPGAVLSHRSAATLWKIRDGEGPRPDVTLPRHSGRRRPGVAIHNSPLEPRDCTTRFGIPVTTATRALFDVAPGLNDDQLARTLRETDYLGHLDLRALQVLLARRPSRRLQALIADPIMTRTELEDRFVKICDRHKLPRPLTQQAVLASTIDFVWPDHNLLVETDGWEAHGTRSAFQSDRAASNAFQLAGYTILRFTYDDLKRRPAHVVNQIRAALSQARSPSRLRG
jgi:very-short-patch-repair endonuclease